LSDTLYTRLLAAAQERQKEKSMVAALHSKLANDAERSQCAFDTDSINWVRIAAGGTLLGGGLLLLTGNRRAGLAAAGAGTALAMLDQKKTVRVWWMLLPGYIDQAQRLLNQVQVTVDEIEVQREQLRRLFACKACESTKKDAPCSRDVDLGPDSVPTA
jgi:hypothetical protein